MRTVQNKDITAIKGIQNIKSFRVKTVNLSTINCKEMFKAGIANDDPQLNETRITK